MNKKKCELINELIDELEKMSYRDLLRVKAKIIGEEILSIIGLKTQLVTHSKPTGEITTYLKLIKPIVQKDSPHYADSFKEVK